MKRLVLIAGLVLASVSLSGPSHVAVADESGNEIRKLIDRVTVGQPYTVRNLTVFPLHVSGETDPTRYATLDEAIEKGWLKVYEKDEGRVQEVLVQNVSPHHVFLMAGEIISGAKQNRVIATDTLLRPDGPEVVVPVYCVEQGRWNGGPRAFNSEKSFANPRLRDTAQSGAGQEAVWEEVSRVSGEAGVESETSDFQDLVEDKEVQKVLDEYAKCMPTPPRGSVGAAIVINNRIVGVELFANEALFAALWPKVRRGYALDASSTYRDWEKMKQPPRLIDERDVQAFLERVHDAQFTARNGVDLGELSIIRGNGIVGEGLIFEAGVVHVNFAPDKSLDPKREGEMELEE